MGKIKKQTIKSTIYAYLGIVLGFISQAWLIPHALSKAEVGLTNNLFAIAIIMVQLAGLGFGNAGVKYFPYFADDKNNHKGFLYLFFKVHLWGFLAICVLLFVGKSLIFSFYHDTLINTYYYAIYVILAATTFFGVFDNFLRCIGNATTGVLLKEFFLRLFIDSFVNFHSLQDNPVFQID